MKLRPAASRLALAFTVAAAGGSLAWWVRNRPFYLLFQAHEQIGKEDQASTIAEYQRLLKEGNLQREDEIRLRTALAQYYIKAAQIAGGEGASFSGEYSRDEIEYFYGTSHFSSAKSITVKGHSTGDHPYITFAEKECKRIFELDPKNGFAHYLSAIALLHRNLPRFANDEFKLAAELNPSDPRPLNYLALGKLEENKALEARELALQALGVQPTYDDARMTLVRAHNRLGEFEKGLEEFDKMQPEYRTIPRVRAERAFYLAGQNYWPEAMAEIDAADKSSSSNGYIKLYYGQILLQAGLYDDASGQFAASASFLPRYLEPLAYQSIVYARRGQCDAAARIAQTAAEYDPRSAMARVLTARVYLCRGDDGHALSELGEALRLDPEIIEAIRLKAEILLDREQYEDLGALIRPLLDKPGYKSEAYVLLAQAFLGQGQTELAQEAVETALKLNRRNAWALAWLGFVRADLKEFDGAERALSEAVKLNGTDKTLAAMRATGKGLSGRWTQAEDELKALVNKDPQNTATWIFLGDAQRRQKHDTDAIQSYQTALGVKPYALRAHIGLAESFQRTGQAKAAEVELQEAMRINPRSRRLSAARPRRET